MLDAPYRGEEGWGVRMAKLTYEQMRVRANASLAYGSHEVGPLARSVLALLDEVERKDWLDGLDSDLFGNARKTIDDHRARHIIHDGKGPKIDVQCLPQRDERGEEVSA